MNDRDLLFPTLSYVPVTLSQALTCPEVQAMVEALRKAGNRLEWAGGLLYQDKARDQVAEWAEEARAALAALQQAALAPVEALK